MVTTLQPTEMAPKPIDFEPSIDRPDGRSIFKEAFLFYIDHRDILPNGYGKVAGLSIEDEQGRLQETHSVALENEGVTRLAWQYTVASALGGRLVRQINLTANGTMTGWSAIFEPNGRALAVRDFKYSPDMPTEDLSKKEQAAIAESGLWFGVVWGAISKVLRAEGVRKDIDLIRTRKAEKERELHDFAHSKQHEYTVETKDSSRRDDSRVVARNKGLDGVEVLRIVGEFGPSRFKKELEEKYEAYKNFGFTALMPIARPTVSNSDIQLRLFWPTTL